MFIKRVVKMEIKNIPEETIEAVTKHINESNNKNYNIPIIGTSNNIHANGKRKNIHGNMRQNNKRIN
jgi:hypothetical protein